MGYRSDVAFLVVFGNYDCAIDFFEHNTELLDPSFGARYIGNEFSIEFSGKFYDHEGVGFFIRNSIEWLTTTYEPTHYGIMLIIIGEDVNDIEVIAEGDIPIDNLNVSRRIEWS